MGAPSNVAPVIVKKKKVVGGDGHHGGAWKVAYADFVTAMMAFFMLMWLLNATTEKQRKGLADYFSPTIPINRVSGGGDGAFGGENMFSEKTLLHDGSGATQKNPADALRSRGVTGVDRTGTDDSDPDEALKTIEEALNGRGGESLVSHEALKHIVTRVTDEGLIVELFATEDAALFEDDSERPTQLMKDLAHMIARVSEGFTNPVALAGHVRSRPVVVARNPVWELSADRADRVRRLLAASGMANDRFRRVTGHADRSLVGDNPLSRRNDRIEITFLRRQPL